MLKKGLLLFLVLTLSVSLVYAVAPNQGSYKGKPMTPEKLIGPNSILPKPDNVPPVSPPFNTDDPVGEVFMFGNSWYDIQHNSTCGRQVQVDSDGWIHVVWMKGFESGAINRHIFYQLMDPNDVLQFTTPTMGVQVDVAARSGYTVGEVHSDNRCIAAFHQGPGGTANFHTALAFDVFPRTGIFMTTEAPWVGNLEVIWPKMDKDIDDIYHVMSFDNPPAAGDPQNQYYVRGELDLSTYTVNWDPAQQEYIDWTTCIAGNVAASSISNRVAVAWLKPMATTPDTTQYDNNVYLVISEDGVNFDWGNPINITQFIPPDYSLLPDTAAADKDTLRAYCDIDLLFDSNDVLHVAFSTRGYYVIEGTLSWGNGYIFHWDEVNQVFSKVADGWYSNGFYDPGAWNVYCQRASMGEDPATGNLYCMYQRYLDPVSWNPLTAGTSDFSMGGWPNGEIWMTVSTDGGYNWARGTNITNTHTPNAPPGQCLSELTPSMAPDITNGYTHVFYIEDRDAGAVVQTEGGWTDNEVMYHRVPVNEIATTPLNSVLPNLHHNGQGANWPPLTLVVTMTPENPPIVIPAAGGTFDFTVEIENIGTAGGNFDGWIDVILPNGNVYPVLSRSGLYIGVGGLISRDLTQNVPGAAPAGSYDYYAHVGVYPASVWDEDFFSFTKSAVDASSGDYTWVTTGWGEDSAVEIKVDVTTPSTPVLTKAYPNPFNPTTTIGFELSMESEVEISVFNVLGEHITTLVSGTMNAGNYHATWDASDMTSGMYFYQIKVISGDGSVHKDIGKLLLLK